MTIVASTDDLALRILGAFGLDTEDEYTRLVLEIDFESGDPLRLTLDRLVSHANLRRMEKLVRGENLAVGAIVSTTHTVTRAKQQQRVEEE